MGAPIWAAATRPGLSRKQLATLVATAPAGSRSPAWWCRWLEAHWPKA